ncbi:MAG: hypothetical protein U0996_01735 [Planctomycetaceae bacterium]
MSSHLPENLDEWPVSPSQVLNVPSNADRTEIRRAYAALIRKFRPETHPSQFQRLREAMEILLEGLQRGVNNSQSSESSLDLAPIHLSEVGQFSRPEQNAEPIARPVHLEFGTEADRFQSQLNQLWDEYSQDPSALVIQRLHSLAVSSKHDVTPFLMGYWATQLTPQLSPELHALRWLSDGLERFGGDAELVRLLLREFRSHPEYLAAEHSGHLSRRILNSANLQVYLSERWQLLARQHAWKQIQEEYDQTQRRLAFSHPSVWFRLLSRIFELGILAEHADGRFLARQAFEELQAVVRVAHAGSATEYEDALRVIAKFFESHDPSRSPALSELIADAPALDEVELRRRLNRLVYGYIGSPFQLMDLLTELIVVLPEALWILTLSPEAWLDSSENSQGPDESTVIALRHFLKLCGKLEYPVFRNEVLDFCRNECLSSTAFLEAARSILLGDRSSREAALLLGVLRDPPLLLTCDWVALFLRSSGPPRSRTAITSEGTSRA